MKSPIGHQHIFVVLLVLALAQFACGYGAPPSSTSTPPPPSTLSPATPPPATPPPATPLPTAATTDRGTPDEAKAMLQKAVEHYNSVGRNQALSDFTGRVAPFFDRDLYVACIDSRLVQSANGGFPYLVGSSVQPLSRAAWDAATNNNVDSVHYNWLNPANGKTEPKTFFYEKVGSDVCGVGAYSP